MHDEKGASIELADADGFALRRRGRFLWAELKKPHLVLSTSHVNGGQAEHVRYLANHQSSEGRAHKERHDALTAQGPEAYHRRACEEGGLPADATALMGTAADMQYASVAAESFQDASVWAVVTAGVQGNAGRAGDPAKWHESDGAWKPVHAQPGTINTLLLFGCPLTPAALARAVATMSEAKTAVLHELAVGSRYSPHLATGTGTDQFCLAAPLDAARKPKTWTGKHGKLGEILAQAMLKAMREALLWQNGLEPSRTRNLAHALGRFGIEEAKLMEAAGAHLEERDRDLLRANFTAVIHEPQTAGAAYALAAVQDRLSYGTLPPGAALELVASQAALMACSIATKPERFAAFRSALAEGLAAAGAAGSAPGAVVPAAAAGPELAALAAKALALGWREKWR